MIFEYHTSILHLASVLGYKSIVNIIRAAHVLWNVSITCHNVVPTLIVSFILQYGTLCYMLYSHASRQLNQVCSFSLVQFMMFLP